MHHPPPTSPTLPPPPFPPPFPRQAVFFDRDDTLIRCNDITPTGDLGDPNLVQLHPHALETCKSLSNNNFRIIVITNQGGVARGSHTPRDVERVNARVNELLSGLIDAFRFCPWHPNGIIPEWTREHPWRKPAPGMLLDAAAELEVDLSASWIVGDAIRDCQAGRAAGCRTILLSSDHSPPSDPAAGSSIDFTAPDLAAAAEIILAESSR